jgi:replicative DNA helicase
VTDAVDHGKVVLATILSGRKDLLQVALRHLQAEHFTDVIQRGLFGMCERYLDAAGEILPLSAVGDILRAMNQPPGTVLQYEEYYAYLISMQPEEADFRWSVQQLRELAAETVTGEMLAQSMEILKKGRTEGKRHLQGHKDAREWLLAKTAEIERNLHQADAPEGDMRLEVQDIVTEYGERRQAAIEGTAHVQTSLPELDDALGGGIARGELALVGGFTTAGKTSVCVQMAWHAVVAQGRNVVIFTSETLRSQIRVKILARHSRLERFGLPEGINSKLIKGGLLDREGAMAFQEVLTDWKDNEAYGKCYVAQVPRGATISTLEARLRRLSSAWRADMVIVDYLQLLRTSERFGTDRESQSRVVKDAKELAATYLDGYGVPLVSPWQMSRKAREEAKGGNGYSLSSLADTHEAAATPDVIFSVLEPDDYFGGRHTKLKFQVLKGRDGERGKEITVDADYATSHFMAQSGTTYSDLVGLENQEGM